MWDGTERRKVSTYVPVDRRMKKCPNCGQQKPAREIDGSYPYDCCEECYWNLDG